MKNNKGQALVEFIIILPVLLLIIIAAVDLSSVIYKQYNLESDLDFITELYQKGQTTDMNTYASTNNFRITITTSSPYTTITVKKDVEVITPGLNIVLGNPYTIILKRVIYNE